jgi:hypothetical protein
LKKRPRFQAFSLQKAFLKDQVNFGWFGIRSTPVCLDTRNAAVIPFVLKRSKKAHPHWWPGQSETKLKAGLE